jgi:hypothetical protein
MNVFGPEAADEFHLVQLLWIYLRLYKLRRFSLKIRENGTNCAWKIWVCINLTCVFINLQ